MVYEQEYELAKSIAEKVNKYALREQQKVLKAEMKEDNSFATEADIAAEKKIIKAIKKAFPNDHILAEETSDGDTIERNRLWIIDPIDGTHGFMAKEDEFCTIIGFVDNNEIQFAVVAQAAKKRITYAKKGEGCFCNQELLETTRETDLRKVLVGTALWYYTKNNKLETGLQQLKRVLESCLDMRRYGAAGLDQYRVASGKEGAYYEFGLKPWDAVASILVTEAGGKVSNPDGTPLNLFERENNKWCVNLLASANKEVHEKIQEAINKQNIQEKA